MPRDYGPTLLQEVLDKVDPDDSGPQTDVPVNWLLAHGAGFGPPYVQSNDSGGGLFLGHVTDSSTLLGIASAAFTDEDDPNVHASSFVQLSAYRDWIDATMATDPFDTQTALWVSSVPEPATALLWAGALALAGVRRGLNKRRSR